MLLHFQPLVEEDQNPKSKTQKIKKQKDQRKVITGQAVTSYDKGDLIEISNILNISVKPGFDKEQLGINIKQFLIENNRVLK